MLIQQFGTRVSFEFIVLSPKVFGKPKASTLQLNRAVSAVQDMKKKTLERFLTRSQKQNMSSDF